jgi:hypothetical protein
MALNIIPSILENIRVVFTLCISTFVSCNIVSLYYEKYRRLRRGFDSTSVQCTAWAHRRSKRRPERVQKTSIIVTAVKTPQKTVLRPCIDVSNLQDYRNLIPADRPSSRTDPLWNRGGTGTRLFLQRWGTCPHADREPCCIDRRCTLL